LPSTHLLFSPAQVRPQVPQLLSEFLVLTQASPHNVSPCGQLQERLTQVCGGWQELSQEPQNWLELRSRQVPLQLTSPCGHWRTQAPSTHLLFSPGQGRLQPPQWASELLVLTQASPHWVWPCGQLQERLMQVCGASQELVQEPQNWLELRSRQVPLQLASPSGHTRLHCPPIHTSAPPQARVQEPQKFRSLARLRQAPLHRVSPCGQLQLPPMQACPIPQTLLQSPQARSSMLRFLHVPPQLVSPPGHWRTQRPPVHWFMGGQGWLQPPQWASVLPVSTQAPLQTVWPGGQTMAQVPPMQVWPSGQSVPQVPQLFSSTRRSRQLPLQQV
jgi:hypothetical protein